MLPLLLDFDPSHLVFVKQEVGTKWSNIKLQMFYRWLRQSDSVAYLKPGKFWFLPDFLKRKSLLITQFCPLETISLPLKSTSCINKVGILWVSPIFSSLFLHNNSQTKKSVDITIKKVGLSI